MLLEKAYQYRKTKPWQERQCYPLLSFFACTLYNGKKISENDTWRIFKQKSYDLNGRLRHTAVLEDWCTMWTVIFCLVLLVSSDSRTVPTEMADTNSQTNLANCRFCFRFYSMLLNNCCPPPPLPISRPQWRWQYREGVPETDGLLALHGFEGSVKTVSFHSFLFTPHWFFPVWLHSAVCV